MAKRRGSCCSDPVVVICGVPQGSMFGPLLFVLYTADIAILLPLFIYLAWTRIYTQMTLGPMVGRPQRVSMTYSRDYQCASTTTLIGCSRTCSWTWTWQNSCGALLLVDSIRGVVVNCHLPERSPSSAEGPRIKALEAPRGWGLDRGLPLPADYEVWESVASSPSGV